MPTLSCDLRIDFEKKTARVYIPYINYKYKPIEERTGDFEKSIDELMSLLSIVPHIVFVKTSESIESYIDFDFASVIPPAIWEMAWDTSLLSINIQQQLAGELIKGVIETVLPNIHKMAKDSARELIKSLDDKEKK